MRHSVALSFMLWKTRLILPSILHEFWSHRCVGHWSVLPLRCKGMYPLHWESQRNIVPWFLLVSLLLQVLSSLRVFQDALLVVTVGSSLSVRKFSASSCDIFPAAWSSQLLLVTTSVLCFSYEKFDLCCAHQVLLLIAQRKGHELIMLSLFSSAEHTKDAAVLLAQSTWPCLIPSVRGQCAHCDQCVENTRGGVWQCSCYHPCVPDLTSDFLWNCPGDSCRRWFQAQQRRSVSASNFAPLWMRGLISPTFVRCQKEPYSQCCCILWVPEFKVANAMFA